MASQNNNKRDHSDSHVPWKISSGLDYALLAGIFAAFASVFAKLAFDSEYIKRLTCGQNDSAGPVMPLDKVHHEWSSYQDDLLRCDNVAILIRCLCALMILLSNALMFRSFSKSLLLCNSTAEATMANTAANYCVSALFGWLLFKERLSHTWLIGTSLVVIGLAIIHKSKGTSKDENRAKKRQ